LNVRRRQPMSATSYLAGWRAAVDAGLHGNTQIAFADLNNEAVADELPKWLHREGLDKFAGE
jgi:hypothetical protein